MTGLFVNVLLRVSLPALVPSKIAVFFQLLPQARFSWLVKWTEKFRQLLLFVVMVSKTLGSYSHVTSTKPKTFPLALS